MSASAQRSSESNPRRCKHAATVAINAWVGYGNGFYANGPSPNTAIGGLNLAWKPTLLSTGVIGYQHDFQNSLLGAYYDMDLAYISWQQLVWRFTGFVRLQYANERFNGVNPPLLESFVGGGRRVHPIGDDVAATVADHFALDRGIVRSALDRVGLFMP